MLPEQDLQKDGYDVGEVPADEGRADELDVGMPRLPV